MPRNKQIFSGLLGTLLLFVSKAASAHPLSLHGAGLGAGLCHPLLGLDHLLAMVAVGMWAVHAAGRRAWIIPLSFVLATAAGGALAMFGTHLPMVEPGIAVSVIVLGLLLAFAIKLPTIAGASLVALFAIVHGHAHGLELPLAASPWMYSIGFLATTASLHVLGMFLAWNCKQAKNLGWLRASGALMAGIGAWMLITI